ncbi:hypothetical protein H696_03144 [Fonticula alba]|uniref:Repressor of RNA polymerase III transcription n=1 Tax=Fonticula alba TaxID=691883 RepID=A0A058ZA31_FONAL|nr:hypothetical protein H696_03144 [Fonticula alba]KCV70793.1 hypothetical protein H696_03144 [Fonticula alba]|eukprot:XP_009495309.1 hypothetical protein H696_03144 [Fonticula alba]
MKYLEFDSLDRVNADFAGRLDLGGEARVTCKIEAYSCKAATQDKRLYRSLESRYNHEATAVAAAAAAAAAASATLPEGAEPIPIENISPLVGAAFIQSGSAAEGSPVLSFSEAPASGANPIEDGELSWEMRDRAAWAAATAALSTSTAFGPLSHPDGRKMLHRLILVLNAAYPDYDFSGVRPDQFTKLDDLERVLNSLQMAISPESSFSISSILPNLSPPASAAGQGTLSFGGSQGAAMSGNGLSSGPLVSPTGASTGSNGASDGGRSLASSIPIVTSTNNLTPFGGHSLLVVTPGTPPEIPLSDASPFTRLCLALDEAIGLSDSEIFLFTPDPDSDPLSDLQHVTTWSYHYFFYSKKKKRVVYLSAFSESLLVKSAPRDVDLGDSDLDVDFDMDEDDFPTYSSADHSSQGLPHHHHHHHHSDRDHGSGNGGSAPGGFRYAPNGRGSGSYGSGSGTGQAGVSAFGSYSGNASGAAATGGGHMHSFSFSSHSLPSDMPPLLPSMQPDRNGALWRGTEDAGMTGHHSSQQQQQQQHHHHRPRSGTVFGFSSTGPLVHNGGSGGDTRLCTGAPPSPPPVSLPPGGRKPRSSSFGRPTGRAAVGKSTARLNNGAPTAGFSAGAGRDRSSPAPCDDPMSAALVPSR